jgi:hypothetical protein
MPAQQPDSKLAARQRFPEEIDMNRLPLKQQIAFAALGTAAAACTLALAVLAPLVA